MARCSISGNRAKRKLRLQGALAIITGRATRRGRARLRASNRSDIVVMGICKSRSKAKQLGFSVIVGDYVNRHFFGISRPISPTFQRSTSIPSSLEITRACIPSYVAPYALTNRNVWLGRLNRPEASRQISSVQMQTGYVLCISCIAAESAILTPNQQKAWRV